MARNFAGGSRMTKRWEGIFSAGRVSMTAEGTFVLGTSAAFVEAGTILRLIGEVVVVPQATGITDNDAANITMGVALVSSDAAELGATAMPDPDDEAQYDWLWWWTTTIDIPNASEFGGAASSARVPIASKAMRRFKPRSSLVVVAQYTDITGLPGINASVGLRFLRGV